MTPARPRPVLRTARRAGATAAVVGVLVGLTFGSATALAHSAASTPERLTAAQQAEAAATSSEVVLSNASDALNPEGAPFPDLEVTVSQTRDLVSQGIRVSWSGGVRSEAPQNTVGGANFLQIAQCWGEDPEHPGHPDRRTCQYGGTLGGGATRDGLTKQDRVAPEDEPYTVPDFRSSVYTAIPFVANNDDGYTDENEAPEDRVVTALAWDEASESWVKKTGDAAVDVNTNPFFTQYTTNEVRWAPTAADGTGSVPFEVQTAMQSEALGCGEPVENSRGRVEGRSCWLVIIPRGDGDSGSVQIDKPGLWWDAWEHHLAVELEFKPLGVRCEIGAAEQQLAGSELAVNAINSWQPELCTRPNGAAFVQRIGAESDALQDASGETPSPLALTSLPLDPGSAGLEEDPLAYAPVALSASAITFAIDSSPHPQNASPAVEDRRGLPLTDLKLTPRLVAKLLTASYVDALPNGAVKNHIGYESYDVPGKNPRTLLQDPEFLEINGGPEGEWAQQAIIGASIADALLPDGRSDQATQLWEYVFSDAEAQAWLSGVPDKWGMIVNPYYSTGITVNPTGVPLTLPRDNFPKADPVEKPDTTATDLANGTGAINLVTWRPYTGSFADGAYHVLRGDGMLPGAWDRYATPPKFGKSVRELFGSQRVIALTTAPAAEQYQTVTASLRNPAGKFVRPTRASIAAAAAAMTPSTAQDQVLRFDYAGERAKTAPAAYPLAAPVYAALNPAQSDAKLRSVYADLIRFAADEGQQPGTDLGKLPPGYAPMPKSWVKQALAVADEIEGAEDSAKKKKKKKKSDETVAVDTIESSDDAPMEDPADPEDPTPLAAEPTPTPADEPSGPLTIAVPAGLATGALAAAATPFIGRVRRRA